VNDKFERSTTGYLPEAHIAFLDETFKGSSAILNTLLTLLNERIFYNGTEARKCPLLMVVGASNEFGDDDVEALYDRFLLRYELEYVQDQNAVLLFRFETPQVTAKFSLAQLQQARSLVQQTTVSDDVLKVLVSIRTQLRLRGVFPSDRRLRQCLDLLKAKSWLDGVPIGEHQPAHTGKRSLAQKSGSRKSKRNPGRQSFARPFEGAQNTGERAQGPSGTT